MLRLLCAASVALPAAGWADVIAAAGAKHTLPSTRLVGPVRGVRQERALFVNPSGQPTKWVEDGRLLTDVAGYDRAGRLTDKTSYTPDGAQAVRMLRTYDDGGRLVSERLHDAADTLWRKTRYLYDAAGRLTLALSTDADGDIWFRDVYLPNAAGAPVRVDHHDPDGTFLHRASFTYDEQRRVIRRSLSDADGSPISSNTYRYDPSGWLIEVVTHSRSGALVSRWRYRHDPHGNERLWTSLEADGSVRTKERYVYEYDARGNWLKRVTLEWVPHPKPEAAPDAGSFEPAEVVYRTISYYAPDRSTTTGETVP